MRAECDEGADLNALNGRIAPLAAERACEARGDAFVWADGWCACRDGFSGADCAAVVRTVSLSVSTEIGGIVAIVMGPAADNDFGGVGPVLFAPDRPVPDGPTASSSAGSVLPPQ